jgi:hypothetical protein
MGFDRSLFCDPFMLNKYLPQSRKSSGHYDRARRSAAAHIDPAGGKNVRGRTCLVYFPPATAVLSQQCGSMRFSPTSHQFSLCVGGPRLRPISSHIFARGSVHFTLSVWIFICFSFDFTPFRSI